MSDLVGLGRHPPEVLKRSNKEHERLIPLIGRGDAGKGRVLIGEHLEGTKHVLASLMPVQDA